MAESRRNYRGVVVGILIGLLVLAFAMWGVEDVFNPQSGSHVLKIGDEEVSSNEFRRLYEQELRFIAEEEGKTPTNEQAMARGIPQRVVSQMLSRKTLEVDASDLGIGYNAKSARKDLSEMDVFKDPISGEFSPEQVDVIMARQYPPMTRRQFADDLVRRMRLEQTLPAITRGVEAPAEFADTFYNYINETRTVSVLTLNDKAVETPPEPTDEQIQTYIDENINTFTLPEFRQVSMIRLEPTDFVLIKDFKALGLASEEAARSAYNNIFITEQEFQDQYDIKVASENLATPAKRSLSMYFAENEDTANTIAEKLKEGLSASEITALLGLSEPTTYEDVEAAEIIDPAVADAAFEMAENEIKTLEGGFGQWVAVQVTKVTEAFQPARDTVEGDIEREILNAKAQQQIYNKIDAVFDEIEDGRTLEEAADTVGVPFTRMPFVSRFGATQDELTMRGTQRLPGIATDQELLRTIFTSNPGFEVDAFETSNGGQAIIRVDEIIEQTPKSFEASKNKAAILWKDQEIENALEELMQSVGDRVADGETLEAVADELGDGAVIKTFTLERLRGQPEIGKQLWGTLIEGEEGDVTRGLGPEKMTRQVAKLEKIIPNEKPIPEQEQSLIQDRLTAMIVEDILIAYQNAVHKDTPYNVNDARIEQILGVDRSDQ